MRSSADTAIVERDRQLPGLRTLLDEGEFCASLRRMAPGRDVRSARAHYMRYKPGQSCLVAYEVQIGETTTPVYARCHAEDQVVKVSNARLRLEVRGPLGHGLLTDPSAGIAVFVYPNDYEIKSLRKLFEGERTPRRLRRILPVHPHLHTATPTVLRYKPERRFVGKFESEGGPTTTVRLYPESRFPQMREKAWAFRSVDGLNIARLVGDSERYSALAHEWVEGQTPSTALLGDDAVITSIARALSALHRQRPRLGTLYSARDYCRNTTGAVEALAALDDEFGARASGLADAALSLLDDHPWRPLAVHGDFTADQVLIDGPRVTVLDFDRAGYGDPAMDLGAFSAGLIASAARGDLPLQLATEIASHLVSAYRRESGVDDLGTVRAFTAASLLMMAPEPFRHRVADWPDATAALLDSIDHVLTGEVIDA